MSKEIAQTVGGKKIAWLIAIVAAFAVFATLGTQWQTSSAALPTTTIAETASTSTAPGAAVSYTATATFNPSGSVANAVGATFTWNFDDALVFVNVTGAGFGGITNANCAVGAGNAITCTSAAVSTWSTGALTFNFTNPASGTITSPNQCNLTDGNSVACTGTPAAYSIVGTTVNPITPVGAGQPLTISFNIPAGLTYCSDVTNDGTRAFSAGDQTATGVTVQSTTPDAGSTGAAGTHTVVVVDDATAGGSVSISTHLITDTAGTGCTTTSSGDLAAAFVNAELRHMSDTANVVVGLQDISNNVRGSRHTICTVAENTGIDNNADGDTTDVGDVAPVAVQIPGITLANINITNGGGYATTADTDPDFTDVRIFTGDGSGTGAAIPTATAGLSGATCISWVSTDAGDQQINIVYVGANGLQYNVSWDNQAVSNRALIKEWNRLESSALTIDGVSQGTAQNVTVSRGLVLNPAYGSYEIATSDKDVDISDVFLGSHTNSAGGAEGPMALAGVNWTVSLAGCAADLDGASSGTTFLNPDGSVGGNPSVDVEAGSCLPGQSVVVTFTGTEPGPLGSGAGKSVTETVTITFTQNVAEKQVFLAWAGQRIILEHDWRLAPGDGEPHTDDVGPTPVGACAFTGGDSFLVQYVKGTGPGNFVPGLGATVSGNDAAEVHVGSSDNSQTLQIAAGSDDDIINDPQDNCISRVLYESEDPGEVDIEAFASWTRDGDDISNYTKVAFVVYYMKINTINVSLVTQVAKPTHNASGYDYAPGNPWDASKDDADNATDWNVSKDLLVRGRVTGWFLNSNPSGRAADTSNPLNVLPANRWVMPQDWPLLAGGPADPADGSDAIGTAEQFRPYYDIMFAPNNGRGLALGDWDGLGTNNVAFVAAGNVGTGSSTNPIKVTTCSLLTAGRSIWVGATPKTVGASPLSCVGTSLYLTAAFVSAPAAGTPILVATGVPFEGPYSLLDIVGFAADGKGGAALSDWDAGNIRDAAKDDGDVDMWDAPMPPSMVSVAIRGTGFIKEVHKHDVYYLGTPDTPAIAKLGTQLYPNPFYIQDIPDSPFIPAVVAGGGYLWNTWGNDGPGGNGQGAYEFWQPVLVGTNSEGIGDALSSTDTAELGIIRSAYGDSTIARDLVVYTDNHGEFMVTANGDFKTDLTACATNVLAGGKHCKPGDKVGTGSITATVDYPDFRGKHFPVLSNAATVTWTWGGYKDVTVENGETDQYKYIVFHGMDRDGFCSSLGTGAVLLHSVLSGKPDLAPWKSQIGMDDDDTDFSSLGARYNGDPDENVDFLIDSGEGIIIGQSGYGAINDGKQFATDVPTFSLAENNPAVTGIKEFPLSSLAASGQTDECQAWIKVSNSLLGILNVLAIANDDEGNIGFDKIIDLTNTTSYTLNFRWSLVTWAGADSISVNDAIKGTGTSGKNPGGNDISASVTAIYGWDASAQQWLGFFPTGVNVPGANDLTTLQTGQAYWIAITGPSSVTWTIASNVN